MGRIAKRPEEHQRDHTVARPRGFAPATVPAGRPKIPSYLRVPGERKVWKELAKILSERRVLTAGDGAVLGLAASLTVRLVEARAKIQELGAVFVVTETTKAGDVVERHKKSPWLCIAQETEKALFECLRELGLTPRNRESVRPAAKSAEAGQSTLDWLIERQQEASEAEAREENDTRTAVN